MNYNSIFMRKSVSPFSTLNSNIESLNAEIGKLKAKINSELKKLDKRSGISTDFVNKYIDVILSRDYYANEISAHYEYLSNLKLKKVMKDMVESYNKFLSNPDNVQTKANKSTKISFKDEHPKYFVKSGNDITGFDVQEHGVDRNPQRVKRIVSSKVLSPLGCTLNGETVMAFIKLEFEQDSDFYGQTERVTEIRLMMMPPNETKWVDAPTKVYNLQGGLVGDLNNIGKVSGSVEELTSNVLTLGDPSHTDEERYKQLVFKTTDSGTILLIMKNGCYKHGLTVLRYSEERRCWDALINSRYGLDTNGDIQNKVISNNSGSYRSYTNDILQHFGKPMLSGVTDDGTPDYHYDNLSIDETFVYEERGSKYYALYIGFELGKEHTFAEWNVDWSPGMGGYHFNNSNIPYIPVYVFTSVYDEYYSLIDTNCIDFHGKIASYGGEYGWYYGGYVINVGVFSGMYLNEGFVGDSSSICPIPTKYGNQVVTNFRIMMPTVLKYNKNEGLTMRFMYIFYMNPNNVGSFFDQSHDYSYRYIHTFGSADVNFKTRNVEVTKNSTFSTVSKLGQSNGRQNVYVYSTHKPFATIFHPDTKKFDPMNFFQFSERIRLPFVQGYTTPSSTFSIEYNNYLDVMLRYELVYPNWQPSYDYCFSFIPLYDANHQYVNVEFGEELLEYTRLLPTSSISSIVNGYDVDTDEDAIANIYSTDTVNYNKDKINPYYPSHDCVVSVNRKHLLNPFRPKNMYLNPLSYTIADDQDLEVYANSKDAATKNKLGKILLPFNDGDLIQVVDIEQFFACNVIPRNGYYYDDVDYVEDCDTAYLTGCWMVEPPRLNSDSELKDLVMRLNVKGKYKKNQQYDHREFPDPYNVYSSVNDIIPSAYRYSIDPNSEITFECVGVDENGQCQSTRFLTFGKSDPTTGTNDGLLHYKEHSITCNNVSEDIPFDIPLTEEFYSDSGAYLKYQPVDYRYNTHREVCTRVAIAFKLTGKPNHDTCVTFDLVLYSEHYPFMRDTRRFMVTWNENEKSWYIDFIRKQYSSLLRVFPLSELECKLDVIKNVTEEYLQLVFYAERNGKYVDLNCADISDIYDFHFLSSPGVVPDLDKKASNYAYVYMVKSKFLAEKYKDHNGPYTVNNHNMRLSITNVGVPVGTDDGETISYEIGLEGVQISESNIAAGGTKCGTFRIFCDDEMGFTYANMDPIRIGEFL